MEKGFLLGQILRHQQKIIACDEGQRDSPLSFLIIIAGNLKYLSTKRTQVYLSANQFSFTKLELLLGNFKLFPNFSIHLFLFIYYTLLMQIILIFLISMYINENKWHFKALYYSVVFTILSYHIIISALNSSSNDYGYAQILKELR